MLEIILFKTFFIVTYKVSNMKQSLNTCGLWRGHTPAAKLGTEMLLAALLSKVQCRLDIILRHLVHTGEQLLPLSGMHAPVWDCSLN